MVAQLVTVEGNLSTGKTTIARRVAEYMPDTRFFPAPEPESNPYWAAFQRDPAAHALALQRWFLRERLRVYLAALQHMRQTRQSAILDFSIWSDVIFAIKHREDGHLTAAEFDEYMQLSQQLFALHLPPPHLTIVLQVDAAVCLQRCEASTTRSSRPTVTALACGVGVRAAHCESAPRQLAHIERLGELLERRWLMDVDPRWLRNGRLATLHPPADLPRAPSLSVLVRDWTDLSQIRASAIADAVMCTPPVDMHTWLAGFLEHYDEERVNELTTHC